MAKATWRLLHVVAIRILTQRSILANAIRILTRKSILANAIRMVRDIATGASSPR